MSTWGKINAGALAILLATVAAYFVSLAVAPPADGLAMMVRLLAVTAAGIGAVIVATSAMAIAMRREASGPHVIDERERAHGGTAARVAYPIALAGMVAMLVVVALGRPWTDLLNTAIAAAALAEGARLAVAVRLARSA